MSRSIQHGAFTLVSNPLFLSFPGSTSVASVANVVTAGTGKATSVANMTSVASVANATRRVSAPLVQLAPAALGHKPLQLHHHPSGTKCLYYVTVTTYDQRASPYVQRYPSIE